MIKVATWNVNSLRARFPHVLRWLNDHNPDILLLQEIKAPADAFPQEAFEDLGYNLCIVGQKTYNGVAILSKAPLDDIITALPGDADDQEARYVQAFTQGWCVASVYVPNGQSLDSPKWVYKMRFLERLRQHLDQVQKNDPHFMIGGDFNVAPTDQDVYDPVAWKNQVLCSAPERQAFQKLLDLGLTDGWRHQHPDTTDYTWWDYRAAGFRRNLGLRIDHLLISKPESLIDTGIDRHPRGWERPSDHAPVWGHIAS